MILPNPTGIRHEIDQHVVESMVAGRDVQIPFQPFPVVCFSAFLKQMHPVESVHEKISTEPIEHGETLGESFHRPGIDGGNLHVGQSVLKGRGRGHRKDFQRSLPVESHLFQQISRCLKRYHRTDPMGKDPANRFHPLFGLDGSDALSGKPFKVLFIGYDPDGSPIPPVDHLYRIIDLCPDIVGIGILECGSRRIIALSGAGKKCLGGGKEHHEIERFCTEQVMQHEAAGHLRRQNSIQCVFLHIEQGLVLENDGRMNNTVDGAKA